MLQVESEIEGNHGGHDGKPRRRVQGGQQAPTAAIGDQRHTDGRRRKDEAHEQRVENDNAEIGWPAPKAADHLGPPWRQQFPHRNGREDGGEDAKPRGGLVEEQIVSQDQRSDSAGLDGSLWTINLSINRLIE